jgi:hypothetical protein
MEAEVGKICVKNKVRAQYIDNKNVDGQYNATACHKDSDHVDDNEIVPTKAHVSNT